jgi:hypothetical protein
MPLKEAKARFKKQGQPFSDKKVQICTSVIFFQTMEISWLQPKQLFDWSAGMNHAAHLKQRTNKKFRAGLVQICEFFCSGHAPRGWACKAPDPVMQLPPDVEEPPTSGSEDDEDEDGEEEASEPSSSAPADEAAPSRARGRAARKPSGDADKLVSEIERSKAAILGGVSRDERHRRRLEGTYSGAAAAASAGVGAGAPASTGAQPSKRRGRSAAPPAAAGAQSLTQSESKGDIMAGGSGGIDLVGGPLLGKRHTRSKGAAELDKKDLANLSPARKAPVKRATSSAAGVTASGSKGLRESGSLQEHAGPSKHRRAQQRAAGLACDGAVDVETAAAAVDSAGADTMPGSSVGALAGHSGMDIDGSAADAGTSTALGKAAPRSALANSMRALRIDAEPAQLANAAPAASTATARVAASLMHASAGAGSAAQHAGKADASTAEGAADGSGDDEAVDGAMAGRQESVATDTELGRAGSEPAGGARRRSRRDATGRKSALELVHGKGKGEDAQKRRGAGSCPPSANRCALDSLGH